MASAAPRRLSPVSRQELPFSGLATGLPRHNCYFPPAPLPHLLLQPSPASGYVVIDQLARLHSLRWGSYASLRPQVCRQLSPDITSRWRPCWVYQAGVAAPRMVVQPRP